VVPERVTTRPRLLFLCQALPYPLDSGVAIRSYHTLRILSRVFDVTALCFYRRKRGLVPEGPGPSVVRLRSLARVEAFPIPQEHSVPRLLWDHLRSLALGRVYTAFAYQSRPFTRRLGELLRTSHFDLVHVDSMVLARYGAAANGAPVVCVHHNVESVLLQRRADVVRGWRRAYLSHQARLMEREERRGCGRWALNVMVSEADRARLRAIAPEASCAVIPNGVDTSYFAPTPGRDEGLVFVGEATWFPNRDALQYFCDAILPLVRAEGRRVPVRWIGRASARTRSSAQRCATPPVTWFPSAWGAERGSRFSTPGPWGKRSSARRSAAKGWPPRTGETS